MFTNIANEIPLNTGIKCPKAVLSNQECMSLVDLFERNPNYKGTTGENNILHHKRFVDISDYDKYNKQDQILFSEIEYKIITAAQMMNNDLYGFELLEYQIQFGRYGVGGKYDTHCDIPIKQRGLCRKLSFSVQVNSLNDYIGGKLSFDVFGENQKDPELQMGEMIIWPSWMPHRVHPVSSGKRYAIFGWLTGPRFK
jgi:predicted 2-oxoglutarate/Fe(II)-dependent dioxygenase YbiX